MTRERIQPVHRPEPVVTSDLNQPTATVTLTITVSFRSVAELGCQRACVVFTQVLIAVPVLVRTATGRTLGRPGRGKRPGAWVC